MQFKDEKTEILFMIEMLILAVMQVCYVFWIQIPLITLYINNFIGMSIFIALSIGIPVSIRNSRYDKRIRELYSPAYEEQQLAQNSEAEVLETYFPKPPKKFKPPKYASTAEIGRQYEIYIAGKLEKEGFKQIRTTPSSGDNGVDIFARKNGDLYAFQCKFSSTTVGNRAVQEVYAGGKYYQAEKSVVVTNSTYTKNAQDTAEKLKVHLRIIP